MVDQENDIKLADYALPVAKVLSGKSPQIKQKRRSGGKFVKGPLPLSWLIAAGKLPGKALVVGVGLWYLSGLTGTKVVKPTGSLWQSMCISRQAAYRSIAALERQGLVEVKRRPGCAPVITLCSTTEGRFA